MIIGEFESKINEKKRTVVPLKFRKVLGDNLILTRGVEQCIVLVNSQKLEDISRDIIKGSYLSEDIRDASRYILGSAYEVEPDRQGRIVVPDYLFKHALLSTDIVFIGLYNWVEIWDKGIWQEKMEKGRVQSSEIMNKLVSKNE